MAGTGKEIYEQLLKTAQTDTNIIGFFLGGSRGKNLVTEYSDYDCDMIVKDDIYNEYKTRFEQYRDNEFDIRVWTLTQFKSHAKIGTSDDFDRYNFTHIKVQVDKLNGEVQKIVDEKGKLPADAAINLFIGAIDAYINSFYRSLKNHRDNRLLESQLDANESINHLLTALFALHSRIRPYNKYLSWELERQPLDKLPWTNEELKKILVEILRTGAIATQQPLFKKLHQIVLTEGFKDIFDRWGSKIDFMENF